VYGGTLAAAAAEEIRSGLTVYIYVHHCSSDCAVPIHHIEATGSAPAGYEPTRQPHMPPSKDSSTFAGLHSKCSRVWMRRVSAAHRMKERKQRLVESLAASFSQTGELTLLPRSPATMVT